MVAGGGATRNHRITAHPIRPSRRDGRSHRQRSAAFVDFSRPAGAVTGFVVIIRWFRSFLAPPPATICGTSGARTFPTGS